MDFLKIAKAWITANNPNTEQRMLAEKRFEICDVCPSKKTLTTKLKIGTVCGECGCPLSKKIFSDEFNDCPLKKWESVDSIYLPKRKNNKTVI
jgi:hypothetical protein